MADNNLIPEIKKRNGLFLKFVKSQKIKSTSNALTALEHTNLFNKCRKSVRSFAIGRKVSVSPMTQFKGLFMRIINTSLYDGESSVYVRNH